MPSILLPIWWSRICREPYIQIESKIIFSNLNFVLQVWGFSGFLNFTALSVDQAIPVLKSGTLVFPFKDKTNVSTKKTIRLRELFCSMIYHWISNLQLHHMVWCLYHWLIFGMADNPMKQHLSFLIIDCHLEIEHIDDDFDNNLPNHSKNKHRP